MSSKIKLILGSTAVGIGVASAVIAVKTHYYQEALNNTLLKRASNAVRSNHFIIDRIIDGDCLGKPLFIGIHKDPINSNTVSSQGIRLGEDGEIKRLISFKNSSNKLTYTFEDDTTLTFSPKDGTYTYKMHTQEVADKKCDISKYKPISMDLSSEFDYLKTATNVYNNKLQ
jgi:hypothetical protein